LLGKIRAEIISYIVQISYKFGNMAQKFLPGYRKRLDYEVYGMVYGLLFNGEAVYISLSSSVNVPGIQGRFSYLYKHLLHTFEEDSYEEIL